MAKSYYIATRLKPSEMATALNVSSVPYLNQKMAQTLRKVAIKLGIKASQKGARLDFYVVDETQFAELTDPQMATMIALRTTLEFRPLLTVDRDALSDAINKVNANPEYRRMDYATKRKYDVELLQAVENTVTKVQEDVKIERPKYCNNTNLKVGDIISVTNGWLETTNAQITKITEAGYQYRAWNPKAYFNRHNMRHAANCTVVGDDHDGSVTIAIRGNEQYFTMGKTKTCRFTAKNDEPIKEGDYAYNRYHSYWYST
jgi:hypothetical protein